MRRMSLCLCSSLLLATPLLAQKGPEGREIPAARRLTPAASASIARPEQRAFFSLMGELVPPGARELKIEVRIDGRTALQETLQLPMDAAGGIFEVLAGDPEEWARLAARAEKAGRRAAVTVTLDGRTLRTFSFADFLAYNRQFQQAPLAVHQPLADVRTVYPEAPKARSSSGLSTKGWDYQCLDVCDSDRDYCYQTEPSCFGVDLCQVCDDQWSYCRSGCWICEEPKSTSQYTVSWIKSTTWVGSGCLQEFTSKYTYDFYNYVQGNARYQRTEHCDGSHTDTYLYSLADTTGSCIRRTLFTCSFASGNATPPFCPF